jgi:hypothetical protein
MKPYNRDEPLISIHIPKTAGTSFVNVLHAWYGPNLYRINQKNRDSLKIEPLAIGKWKSNICLHGHFNSTRNKPVDIQFPQITQYITFLRDPLEHHLSMYFFKKERVQKRNKTYWDWNPNNAPADINDFLVNHPSQLLNHMPSTFNPDNFTEILEKYFVFIGLVEQMDASINKLARLLNKPLVTTAPHVNKSNRNEIASKVSIEAFMNNSRFEYLVYNHVKNLFTRTIVTSSWPDD